MVLAAASTRPASDAPCAVSAAESRKKRVKRSSSMVAESRVIMRFLNESCSVDQERERMRVEWGAKGGGERVIRRV